MNAATRYILTDSRGLSRRRHVYAASRRDLDAAIATYAADNGLSGLAVIARPHPLG